MEMNEEMQLCSDKYRMLVIARRTSGPRRSAAKRQRNRTIECKWRVMEMEKETLKGNNTDKNLEQFNKCLN